MDLANFPTYGVGKTLETRVGIYNIYANKQEVPGHYDHLQQRHCTPLKKGNTLRSVLFWNIMQHIVVIPSCLVTQTSTDLI